MSQKTLQQIFDLAMPYYELKPYMCNAISDAYKGLHLLTDERDFAWDQIEKYLNEHIFLFDLILEVIGCSKEDITLSDYHTMGIEIYSDWENREKTLESFKQQFWEIKNES